MTPAWSCVALFCEDIREERSGQDTLVGIFGDNIEISCLPSVIPKLSLYIRIVFPTGAEPGAFEIEIENQVNSQPPSNIVFEKELVIRALGEAGHDGSPITGLISKTVWSPFVVQAEGRIILRASRDGETVVVGQVRMHLPRTAAFLEASAASEPPS